MEAMTSGGAVMALAFVPILWFALALRRQGSARSRRLLALLASSSVLALGAGLALAGGAFG